MTTAQQTFELENNVQTINSNDEIFAFDADEQKAIRNDAPWKRDPHFFKRAKISAIALIKMVTHARSGGAIEVMGLMQGKVTASGEIIVLDAFALPVEGTETRVNAGAEAYEYMIQYGTSSEQVSRPENVVGWYHSHPGYGCWLSGIDVGTQMENQKYQDPWLAVVIDPNRTISAGSVDIGAFRTFPESYKNSTEYAGSEWQNIPLAKIEDFGVHASQYYPLQVSHFKSNLDTKLLEALWNKYWVTTLSQSPLATNRTYTTERMHDLCQKVNKINAGTNNGRDYYNGRGPSRGLSPTGQQGRDRDSSAALDDKVSPLDKVCHEMHGIASEEQHGIITHQLKQRLFNFQR